MKSIIIKQTSICRSTITGLTGDEMGAGLAVQTDPPLETLNSFQVSQIVIAIKQALNGKLLDVK